MVFGTLHIMSSFFYIIAQKDAEMAPFESNSGAGSRTRTYEARRREIYSLLSLPLDDSSNNSIIAKIFRKAIRS